MAAGVQVHDGSHDWPTCRHSWRHAVHAAALPGGAVVPAGFFDPVSQDADVVGHHVVESLELLLDPLQLHSLSLSLSGPAGEKQAFHLVDSLPFPRGTTCRAPHLLLSDRFGQQSFLALVPLFHHLLLLLQLLQTRLFPPERRKKTHRDKLSSQRRF